MVHLGYTEAQKAIRELVRDFAQNEVAPGAEERDRTAEFSCETYKKLGDLGITGMRFPQEYGGTSTDYLSWCLVVQELGKVDASLSTTMAVACSIGGRYVLNLATKEQKEKWANEYLVPIVNGEATAAGGITEPDAGNDTSGIKTTAVLEGQDIVINGNKAFITNAGLDNCRFVNVVARAGKGLEGVDFVNILVPTGTPGYEIMPKYKKMGLRSSATNELVFNDCRVPADHILGGKDIDARKYFVGPVMMEGRIAISSVTLGIAQACFEQSLDYAKQRKAFKKTISKFQYVQGMLVEMALDIELARLLRDEAAAMQEQGELDLRMSSMVKYFLPESAKRCADYAVQIHGGIGFMDECPVSRYYRDIRGFTIFDGTNEIHKWIIARELGC